jgi:hypothetical protein
MPIEREKSSLLQEDSYGFPYYRKPGMFKHHCLKHAKQTKHPFEILVLQILQGFLRNALSGIRPDVFFKTSVWRSA